MFRLIWNAGCEHYEILSPFHIILPKKKSTPAVRPFDLNSQVISHEVNMHVMPEVKQSFIIPMQMITNHGWFWLLVVDLTDDHVTIFTLIHI